MRVNQGEGSGSNALEAGLYPAVCSSIIDIGTQHGEWQGKEKILHKIIIGFELVEETYEKDGVTQRMHTSDFYTASLFHQAKMFKHLTKWRGKDFTPEELKNFELKNILGVPCVIDLEVNSNGKNNIDMIRPYKGETVLGLDGETRHFCLREDPDDNERVTFDGNFPEWMSDGIRGLVEKSDEYRIFTGDLIPESEAPSATTKPLPSTEFDEDIPF